MNERLNIRRFEMPEPQKRRLEIPDFGSDFTDEFWKRTEDDLAKAYRAGEHDRIAECYADMALLSVGSTRISPLSSYERKIRNKMADIASGAAEGSGVSLAELAGNLRRSGMDPALTNDQKLLIKADERNPVFQNDPGFFPRIRSSMRVLEIEFLPLTAQQRSLVERRARNYRGDKFWEMLLSMYADLRIAGDISNNDLTDRDWDAIRNKYEQSESLTKIHIGANTKIIAADDLFVDNGQIEIIEHKPHSEESKPLPQPSRIRP